MTYDRSGLERIAAHDTYITFDRELGWTVSARTEPASRRTRDLTSNSAGMRSSREYALEPPETGPRLAAFGDSFTHCDDVENDECWTAQLEADIPGTEVLNFGVSGYAPDQAWLRYQREGRAYHPCAVTIGYMVENVNRMVNRFRPFYQPDTGITLGQAPLPAPGRRSGTAAGPGHLSARLRRPGLGRARASGRNDFWYYPGIFSGDLLDTSQFFRLGRTVAYQRKFEALRADNEDASDIGWAYAPESEGLELAARVLIQFARQVEADGATPVVLIFGRKSDVVAMKNNDKKVYEPLLQRLNRADVSTIDVTERLYREQRKTGVERLIDKHYRALGNGGCGRLAQRLPE